MLEPDSRTLLLDVLRPPVGARLDYAVATTFTLDLTTALTAPLALAGFNLSGVADQLAVSNALRSSADRIDIFAQAGMLRAQSWPGDLTALLESSIHTVRRPRPGHLFHPKLWVLRFAEGDERSYRCVVTSRNLTGDRSWDVALRLDSDPELTRVNSGNDGLCRLIEALPELCTSGFPEERRTRVLALADELRRVGWQLPDGADSVRFLAFGVKGGVRRASLGEAFRGYRHLLISPFITAEGIDILLGDSVETEVTVVSRGEELDRLESDVFEDTAVFALHPDAGLGDRESDDDVSTENMLGGLHAKVYVIEANKRSFVYLGSANATQAAFDGNVEILCELSGSTKAMGVHTMVSETAPFRALLRPYVPAESPVTDEAGEVARRLESWLVDVAEVEFVLGVRPDAGDWLPTLRTSKPLPELPADMGVDLQIAPFNYRSETHPVVPGTAIDWELTARECADLTPFFVVSGNARVGGKEINRSVVVVARMVGAPASRLDDVLVRQLDSPEKFLRFLLLLLSLGGDSPTGLDVSLRGSGSWSSGSIEGLLELLVRALAVNPEAVDRIDEIVERLACSADGASVLPAGWDDVWPSVRRARNLLGGTRR